MLKISLCGCFNSREIIEEKIKLHFGVLSDKIEIFEYASIEDMIAAGINFDIYFLHKDMYNEAYALITHVKGKADKKTRGFMVLIDNPISSRECDIAIEHIHKHMEHNSMHLTVEFLTDRGLQNIALSRILYFEFFDRKIKIRTQNSEYVCSDTLRNILSLVSNFNFVQPHKSFILNFEHVVKIKGYTITMSDGSLIPLSQKRSKEFRSAYKKYQRGM